jgi:hypothetical protein
MDELQFEDMKVADRLVGSSRLGRGGSCVRPSRSDRGENTWLYLMEKHIHCLTVDIHCCHTLL